MKNLPLLLSFFSFFLFVEFTRRPELCEGGNIVESPVDTGRAAFPASVQVGEEEDRVKFVDGKEDREVVKAVLDAVADKDMAAVDNPVDAVGLSFVDKTLYFDELVDSITTLLLARGTESWGYGLN